MAYSDSCRLSRQLKTVKTVAYSHDSCRVCITCTQSQQFQTVKTIADFQDNCRQLHIIADMYVLVCSGRSATGPSTLGQFRDLTVSVTLAISVPTPVLTEHAPPAPSSGGSHTTASFIEDDMYFSFRNIPRNMNIYFLAVVLFGPVVLCASAEFNDVTLVGEDAQPPAAHSVILAETSPFFRNILNNNRHHHPLINLKGTCKCIIVMCLLSCFILEKICPHLLQLAGSL